MLKAVAAVLSMVFLVFSVMNPGMAQDKAKEARVEGRIAYSDREKSTITIRTVGGTEARTVVHYDSSTRWISQYHGDKNVNNIDSSQVKDGDYVICVGSKNGNGEFHATTISKRLSHSE